MLNFPMKEKSRQYIYIKAHAEMTLISALISFPDDNVRTGGIINLGGGKTPQPGLIVEAAKL